MTYSTREEFLGPDANFVMRGQPVDQLQEFVQRIDGRLLALHEAAASELRDKTPAEQDAFDHGIRLRDQVVGWLETRQKAIDQLQRGIGVEQAFGGVGASDVRAGVRVSDVTRMSDQQVRDAALRVLEARGRSLRPEQGDRVDTLVRAALGADNREMDGAELARRLLISESEAYRNAFQQIMCSAHPILTGEEAEAVRAMQRLEYRAMSEGSGPVGAYGLPVLIDPSILLASGAEATPILNIARVVPTSTNVCKGVASPPP